MQSLRAANIVSCASVVQGDAEQVGFKGITVCDGCGRDEAMQDFHGVILPNDEWAVVQKFQCEREWPYETQEE